MKRLFGTRDFYRRLIALVIPIMVQNGITNFVNVLDNVMVGRLGTPEMTGVSVTNQLILVFNLCVFGLVSGAGLFGAQFYGKGDQKGVRYTFRFKVLCSVGITALCIAFLYAKGDFLIGAFLKGEGSPDEAAAALGYGRTYLNVMLVGLIPYALAQSYTATLRECGKTVLPMTSGLIAVGVDLVFNWLLIFGRFGLPRMGVTGAAVATVLSRYVELAVLVIFTRKGAPADSFIRGAYRSPYIPKDLARSMLVKALPLMANETCWAAGQTLICQSYSLRGLQVVAANTIAQTFLNLFSVCILATGAAISIVMGHHLGAGRTAQASEESPKLITFSVLCAAAIGVLFLGVAALIPRLYNTDEAVRRMATGFMLICAVTLPMDALANSTYYIMRSGGRVGLTFLFDGGYAMTVMVSMAYALCVWTDWPIFAVYICIRLTNLLKGSIGCICVKKGIWIRNMVSDFDI